jgi:hypothetical protein
MSYGLELLSTEVSTAAELKDVAYVPPNEVCKSTVAKLIAVQNIKLFFVYYIEYEPCKHI